MNPRSRLRWKRPFCSRLRTRVTLGNMAAGSSSSPRTTEGTEAVKLHPCEVLDALPELAWIASLDGSVEYRDTHWLSYTGLTPEQAPGCGWTAAIHPDELPSLEPFWRQVLAGTQSRETEVRLQSADGRFR